MELLVLPRPRELLDDHRRLFDAGRPVHPPLDLPEVDAEAAHLDLAVGPAEVLQVPLFRPAAVVTGPVHPPPRLERVRQERAGRLLGRVQIATADADAGDVDLAPRALRDDPQMLVQDVDQGVGHGTAQRHGLARHGPVHHVVGDVVGRLGRAVGVDHRNPRIGPQPPVHLTGQARLTRDHQVPQVLQRDRPVGAVPGVEHRFEIGRDHLQDGDLLGLDALGEADRVELERLRRDDGAAAGERSGEHLPQRDVEAVGGVLDDDAVLGDPQIGDLGVQVVQHAEVLDHHALGLPGRTRGVDHVGEPGLLDVQPRIAAVTVLTGLLGQLDLAASLGDVRRQPLRRLPGIQGHDPYVRGLQHPADEGGRVAGIDREVRRTALPQGEDRLHHQHGTVHHQRDDLAAGHVQLVGEVPGEPVGPGVQLGEGAPAGRIGGTGQGEPAGRRPREVLDGPVDLEAAVELQLPVAQGAHPPLFTGGQQGEPAQGSVRVGQRRVQQRFERLPEPVDGGRVEEPGVEADGRPQRPLLLGQHDVEGEDTRLQGHVDLLDAQSGGGHRLQRPGTGTGELLELDQDVEQVRRMRPPPLLEVADQFLVRVGQMAQTVGEGAAHLPVQGVEARFRIDAQPERQGPHQHADELFQGFLAAVRHRGAQHQVTVFAVPGQDRGEGADHGGEGGAAPGPGEGLEPLPQGGGQGVVAVGARVGTAFRGAGPGGQGERRGYGGEGVEPVRGGLLTPVLRAPRLPHVVLTVVGAHRRQRGLRTRDGGGVQLGQIAYQQPQGPAVGHEVVGAEAEQVALVPEAGELHAQQRAVLQVEGARRELPDQGDGRGTRREGGGLGTHLDGDRPRTGRCHLLDELLAHQPERGAQAVVAGGQAVHRLLERGGVHRAGELEAPGEVEGDRTALELGSQPDVQLGRGGREEAGGGGLFRGVRYGVRFDLRHGVRLRGQERVEIAGEVLGRVVVEEGQDVEFDAEELLDPVDHLEAADGVAAQVEEGVRGGDGLRPEDVPPDSRHCFQDVDGRRTRPLPGCSGCSGLFGRGGRGASRGRQVGVVDPAADLVELVGGQLDPPPSACGARPVPVGATGVEITQQGGGPLRHGHDPVPGPAPCDECAGDGGQGAGLDEEHRPRAHQLAEQPVDARVQIGGFGRLRGAFRVRQALSLGERHPAGRGVDHVLARTLSHHVTEVEADLAQQPVQRVLEGELPVGLRAVGFRGPLALCVELVETRMGAAEGGDLTGVGGAAPGDQQYGHRADGRRAGGRLGQGPGEAVEIVGGHRVPVRVVVASLRQRALDVRDPQPPIALDPGAQRGDVGGQRGRGLGGERNPVSVGRRGRGRLVRRGRGCLFQDRVHIGAHDAEGADPRPSYPGRGFPGGELPGDRDGRLREVDQGAECLGVQAGEELPVPERQHGLHQADQPGDAPGVADVALHRGERDGVLRRGGRAEGQVEGFDLDGVAEPGGGPVGLDVRDRGGIDTGLPPGPRDHLRLRRAVGSGEGTGPVGDVVGRDALDDGVHGVPVAQGVVQRLEQDGDHGLAGPGAVRLGGEGPGLAVRRPDAQVQSGVVLHRIAEQVQVHPADQRHLGVAEHQVVDRVVHGEQPGGAGGVDHGGRPGQPEEAGDTAGRGGHVHAHHHRGLDGADELVVRDPGVAHVHRDAAAVEGGRALGRVLHRLVGGLEQQPVLRGHHLRLAVRNTEEGVVEGVDVLDVAVELEVLVQRHRGAAAASGRELADAVPPVPQVRQELTGVVGLGQPYGHADDGDVPGTGGRRELIRSHARKPRLPCGPGPPGQPPVRPAAPGERWWGG